ncbi:hypothetical protein F5Y00DRAFT_228448 [Daldinia vernicosa]|uniref:uncharacterized protein n=1 Tax=Daldinia vernicosa TaxID=114800 RepID=UPI002008154F|nr:uncharacterized protein F5Y00DRAFT_228448 [Daldinia vernicosa]KAI0852028.1 hypothetical protein F5Y00DRAFT_228448 [Daldinia vernicosa]
MAGPKVAIKGYCAICAGPFETPYFEGLGYKTEIIREEQASWVTKVHVLLEQIPGSRLECISGVGKKLKDNYIELDPEDDVNRLIPDFTVKPLRAIPFHWPCYEILALALYPNKDDPIHHVDLGRLFLTMSLFTEEGASLDLETGAEERQEKH